MKVYTKTENSVIILLRDQQIIVFTDQEKNDGKLQKVKTF